MKQVVEIPNFEIEEKSELFEQKTVKVNVQETVNEAFMQDEKKALFDAIRNRLKDPYYEITYDDIQLALSLLKVFRTTADTVPQEMILKTAESYLKDIAPEYKYIY